MFYAFSIVNAISFMIFRNRIPKDELKGLRNKPIQEFNFDSIILTIINNCFFVFQLNLI